jgi:hypothetical protein
MLSDETEPTADDGTDTTKYYNRWTETETRAILKFMLSQLKHRGSVSWPRIHHRMQKRGLGRKDLRDYNNRFQYLRRKYLVLMKRNGNRHPNNVSEELQMTRDIVFHGSRAFTVKNDECGGF